MDPFLESPRIFTDFHVSFIIYLSEELHRHLPERYYALIGNRTWIEVSRRFIEPDVNVVRPVSALAPWGGAAVAEATAPRGMPLVVTVPHDERREPFIDVYVGEGDSERLVTTVELLSPTNKTPGEHGRDLYTGVTSTSANSRRSWTARCTWSRSTCCAAGCTRRLFPLTAP
jgi:hypothetical protein